MTFNTVIRIYPSRLEAVPLTPPLIMSALRAAGDRLGLEVAIVNCKRLARVASKGSNITGDCAGSRARATSFGVAGVMTTSLSIENGGTVVKPTRSRSYHGQA
jgi:hypothetical protein